MASPIITNSMCLSSSSSDPVASADQVIQEYEHLRETPINDPIGFLINKVLSCRMVYRLVCSFIRETGIDLEQYVDDMTNISGDYVELKDQYKSFVLDTTIRIQEIKLKLDKEEWVNRRFSELVDEVKYIELIQRAKMIEKQCLVLTIKLMKVKGETTDGINNIVAKIFGLGGIALIAAGGTLLLSPLVVPALVFSVLGAGGVMLPVSGAIVYNNRVKAQGINALLNHVEEILKDINHFQDGLADIKMLFAKHIICNENVKQDLDDLLELLNNIYNHLKELPNFMSMIKGGS